MITRLFTSLPQSGKPTGGTRQVWGRGGTQDAHWTRWWKTAWSGPSNKQAVIKSLSTHVPSEDPAILSLSQSATEMFSWATGMQKSPPLGNVWVNVVGWGRGIPRWRQAARTAGLSVDTVTCTDLTRSGETNRMTGSVTASMGIKNSCTQSKATEFTRAAANTSPIYH